MSKHCKRTTSNLTAAIPSQVDIHGCIATLLEQIARRIAPSRLRWHEYPFTAFGSGAAFVLYGLTGASIALQHTTASKYCGVSKGLFH